MNFMRLMKKRRWFGSVLLAIFLLTGCGGGGSDDAGKRWSGLVQLSEEGGGIPQVLMDGSGSALVVWIKDVMQVFSRRYKGEWEDIVAVYQESQSNYWIDSPHLAGNGRGDAVLSWNAAGHAVNVVRYNGMTGTWSAVVNLKPSSESRANGKTRAGIDEDGKIWTVWSQFLDTDNDGNDLYEIDGKYFDGTQWGALEKVGSASDSTEEGPDIDMTMRDESVAVTWNSSSASSAGQFSSVMVSRWDGSTWNEEEVGTSDIMDWIVRYPSIAQDALSNFTVVWLTTNDNPSNYLGRIHSSYLDSATDTWAANLPVDDANDGGMEPKVISGPGGVPVAVWSAPDDNGIRRIWVAWFDRETTEWRDIGTISGPEENAGMPDIASSDSGDLFAVWMEGDTGYYRIMANRFDPSRREWTGPKVLNDTFVKQGKFPKIAVDGDGNAIAVWNQQLDDDSWQVYARFYR